MLKFYYHFVINLIRMYVIIACFEKQCLATLYGML